MCLLPPRGVTWEEFANTNYRTWSVGLFLLKEGCFQVLCRDSCQNTVTVNETLNIAMNTALVTSLQVMTGTCYLSTQGQCTCRYHVSDNLGDSSYEIIQLLQDVPTPHLSLWCLSFVLAACSCAVIIVKFECVSIAAYLLHLYMYTCTCTL